MTGSALAIARTGHTSAIIGNAIYLFGGSGSSGALASVERAAIFGDGSVGGFALVDSGFMTARAGHTSLVIGGAVYVLGGAGTNSALTTVEQATIHDDGSLGPFTTSSGSILMLARSDYSLVVAENFAYLIGGESVSGAAIGGLERASLDSSGGLTAFTEQTSATIPCGGDLSIGNSLYVFIGNGGVAKATVKADGSVGAFVNHTDPAFPSLASYSTVAVGNRVYVIGGQGFGPVSTFVAVAPINADDTIGAFSVVTDIALATPRLGPQLAVVENSVYAFGGSAGLADAPDDVERAFIGADGTLGSFTTVGSTGMSTLGSTATVVGGFLYVIGGELVFPAQGSSQDRVLNTVLQAPIHSDGSLGAFTTLSGVSLLTARYSHTAAIVGGYLYVMGGFTSFSSATNFDPTRTIERAAIAPDGSIGPFAQFSGSLNVARAGATSVVLGNDLNVVCGISGTNTSAEQAALQ